MTTAAPLSATSASGPRDSARSQPAGTALRRAPVLLRLPALQAPIAEEPPSHRTSRPRDEAPPPAPEPEAHAELAEDENHEYVEPPRRDKHTSSSRRERGSRRQGRAEPAKKASFSQWVLGACMLAAGVLGFFALSGDFGGPGDDAGRPDGWSQRAENEPAESSDFNQPQLAETTPVTVRREATAPSQADRNWANPAEGEIAQTPSAQSGPSLPNFMGAGGMPPKTATNAEPAASGAAPQLTAQTPATAPEEPTAQAASHESSEQVQLTAPQNPEPTAANNPYPTTSATGLSPMGSPTAPTAQNAYPTTGYNGGLNAGAPPAARTGMNVSPVPGGAPTAYPPTSGYPSTPGYPSTSSYPPTSGYPPNGAAASPYPNTVPPPAMSNRYERIR